MYVYVYIYIDIYIYTQAALGAIGSLGLVVLGLLGRRFR